MNVQDEYDPARPNDYEEVRRARERQRVEAEQEAERQVELRAQKAAQEVYNSKPSLYSSHAMYRLCVSPGSSYIHWVVTGFLNFILKYKQHRLL